MEYISEDQIQTIIDNSRRLVNKVPWRHQGRSLRGVDCIGLFKLAAESVGILVEMKTNYSRMPKPKDLEDGISKYCVRINKRDALPGDLALVKYQAQTVHLIMFTDLGVIHCSADSGTVVEHSINEHWRRDIVSVWRIKGRFHGK